MQWTCEHLNNYNDWQTMCADSGDGDGKRTVSGMREYCFGHWPGGESAVGEYITGGWLECPAQPEATRHPRCKIPENSKFRHSWLDDEEEDDDEEDVEEQEREGEDGEEVEEREGGGDGQEPFSWSGVWVQTTGPLVCRWGL